MTMGQVDVTVRGAGIFGLSIAWACLQRGARVQVIDPHGPGAGASGGIVGALAPHVPEAWNDKKAFQLASLLRAGDFWRGVARAGGVDPGYARTGRLQPVADGTALQLARERQASAAALWQGRAEWRLVRSADAGAWAPPAPGGWLIHDTLSARLHPRRACDALVAAIRARGGTLAAQGPDRGHVVEATGWAGLLALNAGRARALGGGVKGQAALLDFDAGPGAAQLFADGLHLVPHGDGTLAIGSTSERDFDDPAATDDQLDRLLERARAIMPVLAGAAVLRRWAGIRPRARSRAPMLGRHPDDPSRYIANGGFKIGFGMAPGVADSMAALMLEGRDTIPAAFRPEASF